MRAAEFVREELKACGFKKSELLFAKGLSAKTSPPVVFAERITDPENPTVLIYGHYDVQPAAPLELWETPAFEPTVRDGKLFARGATDDKGQLYTHLAALQLLKGDNLNVNIKVLIEGEEEKNGSDNLTRLIAQNPKKFKADVCVISDTGFVSQTEPAIEIGLRGIVYFEMKVITAKQDLHSGLFGGAVNNPLNLIAKMMHLAQQELLEDSRLRREPENARYPSIDIHGISGGHTAPGSKTVIPSEATVKFSMRIVPSQSTEKVIRDVKRFVTKYTPKGVVTDLQVLGKGEAFLVTGESKYLEQAEKATKKVFGKKPTLTRSGGSIPIVSNISKFLGADVILMGYGLPDDNLHSPNEKFDLEQFFKGIECNVEFLTQLNK